MTFVEMFREVRNGMGWTQVQIADSLDISPQYVCDLEAGRRMPSVELIERICKWTGCGPKGRQAWHSAGARAHGWKVT